MQYNARIQRLMLLNRYYRITQFYSFLREVAIKGIIILLLLVSAVLVLDHFFIDLNALLNKLVESFSSNVIFSVFLGSETILGLLPPEIFIAWSSKSASPLTNLFILASMSYLGGIFAYLIGNRLVLVPAIKNYFESKVAKHSNNLRKWGGLIVVLGAITPLPHAMISLTSGMIKFSLKQYRNNFV